MKCEAKPCQVLCHNFKLGTNEWLSGVVIGTRASLELDDDRLLYDVQVSNGVYYGCHPDCVRFVDTV